MVTIAPQKSTSVAGVMVSIVAFQAMDPGSIPRRRILPELGAPRLACWDMRHSFFALEKN